MSINKTVGSVNPFKLYISYGISLDMEEIKGPVEVYINNVMPKTLVAQQLSDGDYSPESELVTFVMTNAGAPCLTVTKTLIDALHPATLELFTALDN